MKVMDDYIEVNIAGGSDRMGFAIALFEIDECTDAPHHVYFKLDAPLGEVKGFSVSLMQITRESGRQTRRWVFEGTISDKAREKTGYALSENLSGYYDFSTRKGWLRIKRI